MSSCRNYVSLINAQDNMSGQNVITWGVFTDGEGMTYQNQSRACATAVRQVF